MYVIIKSLPCSSSQLPHRYWRIAQDCCTRVIVRPTDRLLQYHGQYMYPFGVGQTCQNTSVLWQFSWHVKKAFYL